MAFKVPRQLRRRIHETVLSRLPRRYPASDRAVTVLIPLAAKDAAKATRCVEAIRRHLRHPVTEIVVAGQDHDAVRDFCRDACVRYVNEKDVLPGEVLNLAYTLGGTLNMNGWIRQQMLKLLAFRYLDAENILAFDADTFLMRDISLFDGERQVLFLSDEYTGSFHAMTEKLLGPTPRHNRSFIAHFMLFQRDLMAGLEAAIGRHCGCGMVEAILGRLDRTITASLSEFELYGNYLHRFHPERVAGRYWYNIKIAPGDARGLEKLEKQYRRFNSVSAHEH